MFWGSKNNYKFLDPFLSCSRIIKKWSIRELQRQKKTSLFLRLAASKDKEGILKLAKEGQAVSKPVDLIREPYVLEKDIPVSN